MIFKFLNTFEISKARPAPSGLQASSRVASPVSAYFLITSKKKTEKEKQPTNMAQQILIGFNIYKQNNYLHVLITIP